MDQACIWKYLTNIKWKDCTTCNNQIKEIFLQVLEAKSWTKERAKCVYVSSFDATNILYWNKKQSKLLAHYNR